MNKAKIVIDKDYAIDEVDKRLFGSFVEHMTRSLYHGPYEPGHPSADSNGFRGDVKKLIGELGVTAIRYPGGNFVSGYHWKDGIGPKENRPVRKNMAWNTLETNEVGTDEFSKFLKDINVECIMAVNLGTGTPEEAAEEVEYCNVAGGTYWSDKRIENGSNDPYDIKLWCLGNEMDGAWQINARSPEDYARKCQETAKMVKWIDPDSEVIACGSSTNETAHRTLGIWDRIVLEECYDSIDYLSLHRYFNYHPEKQLAYPMSDCEGDIPFFFKDLQNYIDMINGAILLVKGEKRSEHSVRISFDEWGVITDNSAVPGGKENSINSFSSFKEIDAVIYGGILTVFLNNADTVKIACQSLLVNEGGMISTDPSGKAIRQTVFYPFQDVAKYARGRAIRISSIFPEQETCHHGLQKSMTAACTYDDSTGDIAVFVMNCDIREKCRLMIDLRSFGNVKPLEWRELYNEDPHAVNSFEDEFKVLPVVRDFAFSKNGIIDITIKEHSWNVFRFCSNQQ